MENFKKIKSIIGSINPKNISMNIIQFCSILEHGISDLSPTTDRDILNRGFYGTFFGSKIWVSRIVEPGFVHICNQELTKFADGKWSLPIDLTWDINSIERRWNLKAFW